jgi:hypothetical protein
MIARALALLFLLLPLASAAQPAVVPDTLDWRRYFPLAVGNAWEYGVSEGGPPFWHVEVIDTFSTDEWDYFVLRDHFSYLYVFDSLVRYDSLPHLVFVKTAEEDTLAAPRHSARFSPGLSAWFDLSAAFGDTLAYPPSLADGAYEPYYVDGGYDRRVSGSLDVAALKCFCLGAFGQDACRVAEWGECYAADVGFVGGGSLQSSWIRYARVGEFEWGERLFTGSEGELASGLPFRVEAVYPNPARGWVTLSVGLDAPASVRVTVYDLAGRLVRALDAADLGPGAHRIALDASALASGVYVARAEASFPAGGRASLLQRFTVAR